MTTNSYIFMDGGLSLVLNDKPYSVHSSHPNFEEIKDKLRERKFEDIPDLIDMKKVVKAFVETHGVGDNEVEIDVDTNTVMYRGEVVHNVIVDRIFTLLDRHFTITPLIKFLGNLMRNPSKKAVDQLYTWMEKNGITITEDGFLVAYKRVNDNYKSFYDGKTDNSIGTTPSMPRNSVDDRSEVTCSTGLHFCCHSYLPQYCRGQGRILMLKIDPADVVSIPIDYNYAKGRASRYFVAGELTNKVREVVETKDILDQVVVDDGVIENVNVSDDFKNGYQSGYREGRGKKKNRFKTVEHKIAVLPFTQGYICGFHDGKHKSPKIH